MQWRVMVKLRGADGSVQIHELHVGGCLPAACSAETSGLTQPQAKQLPAELQRHLVQAQTEKYCRSRRHCPQCGVQRPLKDRRPRQLRSLFGVVTVHVPRFAPCRGNVGQRQTLSPVGEIMPDRCTPEYERPSPRWAPGRPIGVLGRCWTTASRSGPRRSWRPSGSEPCGPPPGCLPPRSQRSHLSPVPPRPSAPRPAPRDPRRAARRPGCPAAARSAPSRPARSRTARAARSR